MACGGRGGGGQRAPELVDGVGGGLERGWRAEEGREVVFVLRSTALRDHAGALLEDRDVFVFKLLEGRELGRGGTLASAQRRRVEGARARLFVEEGRDALDPLAEGGEPAAFLLGFLDHLAHLLLALFEQALLLAELEHRCRVLSVGRREVAHRLCEPGDCSRHGGYGCDRRYCTARQSRNAEVERTVRTWGWFIHWLGSRLGRLSTQTPTTELLLLPLLRLLVFFLSANVLVHSRGEYE